MIPRVLSRRLPGANVFQGIGKDALKKGGKISIPLVSFITF